MSIIFILLPLALLLGLGFLVAFARSCSSGQYDDLETPSHRILLEDEYEPKKFKRVTQERKIHV
jgi:cbb3-type cytochrome oxidase maturation protein